jgi:hypothetical protein
MVVEEIKLYILYLHSISKSGMNKALKLGFNTHLELSHTNSNLRPVYTQGSQMKGSFQSTGTCGSAKNGKLASHFSKQRI